MKTPESATDIKVGGKTSDKIKKGLRNAKHVQCMEIASDDENGGTYYGVLVGYVLRDKIYSYITQLESDNESKQKRIDELESRLAQVERERDAAVEFLKKVGCEFCNHAPSPNDSYISNECFDCVNNSNFELRGVCPEAPKEE